MLKKLPISSFSALLAFVCLSIVGLALIPYLSVKLSPSKQLPSIYVNFSLSGQSSKVVETEVTSKLEAMLSRIEGIQQINSTSGNGWGTIMLALDKHTDIDVARFEVATIIRQTHPSLPPQTSYPIISVSKSDDESNRPFISYTINAPDNLSQIYALTEKKIKPKLSNIRDIDRIDVIGSSPMEYRIEYDIKQLEVLGIDVATIQKAINDYIKKEFLGNASVELPSGKLHQIRVLLNTNNTFKNGFDCSMITVKSSNGTLFHLDRIVKVTHQQAEQNYIYRINGLNSIYLSIVAKPTANQLSLSEIIKQKMTEIQHFLPKGYEVHISYDATEYIKEELSKIYFRSGITLLILLLFVLLVYRSGKYLLLIIASLIINLSVAVIVYYLLNLEIHLYSLAGITISITLIIDNIIVMSDQIMRRKNIHVFGAIFAGTLIIIGALSMVFLMDEKIKLNLQDFAFVVIINLIVSSFVVLFVVPVLLDIFKIESQNKKSLKIERLKFVHWNRIAVYRNRFYSSYCRFACRWKYWFIVLLLLGFGVPIFMLPEKIEGTEKWKEVYNQTLGSLFYKETIKPYADVILGGTMRLFIQKVYDGSYFTDRQETTLYLTATLPNGSTMAQMNFLIQRMESYLSQFKEIKQFQTTIENPRRANINIKFVKEHQYSNFPYMLKTNLITKALEMGGGSWSVYGIGDGFSNDISENAGSYQVVLYGYNYDELNIWAEKLKSILLEYRRIKEVTINSEFSWYKEDYHEFEFSIKKRNLSEKGITPILLFGSLNNTMAKNTYAGEFFCETGQEQLYLSAKQAQSYDIWNMIHSPIKTVGKDGNILQVAQTKKVKSPQNINKENQQYRLCAQFEYIGASQQGQKVLEKVVKSFQKQLPIGYTIENKSVQNYYWGEEENKQYDLLGIVLVIIFFMTSILFNSLKQPFAILFVIPCAFIGVFLTFYLFKVNFDQGGFASFILLSGLTVNANIYIIDEYNRIRKKLRISSLNAYIKAWRIKMRPIILTMISTSLGFLPFIIGSNKESFWFPLATGTISGLLFSLIGITLFLPVFLKIYKK